MGTTGIQGGVTSLAESGEVKISGDITLSEGANVTLTQVGQNIEIASTGGSSYTDEDAQDAIGTILLDSASIDFTYDDVTPNITAVVLPAGVDHDSLANTHNLTTDIDHNSITNTHNLTTDIDHNSLTNTHNLTTDIDHNAITNTHNLTTDIDHGSISGLGDDDHSQYHNDARALTWLNTKSVDEMSDVDTTSDAPAKNEVLKWNGTQWVPAVYNASFTFSCSSFSDGESTTQLAGSGTWKADSSMSYTAAYNNGPPTSATVKMSDNGGAYNTVGAMTAPAYTTGTNSSGAISYPTVDHYLRFRLESTDGVDSDTDYDSAIYFYNYVRWGDSLVGSGFTESDVESLTGSSVTSSYTSSRSVNAGASEYVVWAYPSRYTSIHTTGAIFNSVTMPFTSPETVSITNSAGLTENYKVFASTLTNLGSSTLQLSTSSTTINFLYWESLIKAPDTPNRMLKAIMQHSPERLPVIPFQAEA